VTNPDRYPAQVFWSDDDDGFIAIAPDLPGCSAFGESQAEALVELQDAIIAWIEAAHAAGNPVPHPTVPTQESQYSGKVLLRMPRELHAQLARSAERNESSLNQYIVFLLTRSDTQQAVQSVLSKHFHEVHREFVLLQPGWAANTAEPMQGVEVIQRYDTHGRIILHRLGRGDSGSSLAAIQEYTSHAAVDRQGSPWQNQLSTPSHFEN